ncbi:neuromedin-U isoform X2 [Dunckerocampus dactyliophorus]|uniref:neuromedin-U isoform X2 n=1 Tax=Dunckerocampus dactyliophorus TaxID=161453 RepID=UPI002405E0AD|nr:neuromedin-U isoform X2 [Dunckerocampus dactyliophorus]
MRLHISLTPESQLSQIHTRAEREQNMQNQNQSQIQNSFVQRGASSSSSSSLAKLSGGSMSPLSVTAISLAALLVLVTPLCHSAPAELQQATADQRQLLSQVSDVLGEICILMLVQKSKELKGRGNNKRNPIQPLLHLVSHLHTRSERGLSVQAELQGPAGIQSRGYFLYRPRNGRRDLEYK